jgi:hypothetical protein
MNFNKGLDFFERVGWTAIQAGAAATIVALTSSGITWSAGIKTVAIAAALAALKVLVAQNLGSSDNGALPDPADGIGPGK